MTAWLSFAMWLTLMPCGCRGGGGVKCAPIGPKRAKKKCVPTTFLKTAVSHFEFCATHQTDSSNFATLKASLNFALRHRPRVKLPLASLGGISSNKYAPPIEL